MRMADWLEANSMSCFYKKYLGIECPGCGMQRSFAELLRGNLLESFQIFPALLPLMFIFFFLILHLIFKYRKGADVLKYSFIFTALIITLNYILKIVNGSIVLS